MPPRTERERTNAQLSPGGVRGWREHLQVADRRVTQAKEAPRAHGVLGSGEPLTHKSSHSTHSRAIGARPERHQGKSEHRGPVLRHSRSKDMNQAQSVCKQHYTPPPQRSTCSKGPIQSACHSGTGPRLTAESIGAWQERMESAAVEWLRKH